MAWYVVPKLVWVVCVFYHLGVTYVMLGTQKSSPFPTMRHCFPYLCIPEQQQPNSATHFLLSGEGLPFRGKRLRASGPWVSSVLPRHLTFHFVVVQTQKLIADSASSESSSANSEGYWASPGRWSFSMSSTTSGSCPFLCSLNPLVMIILLMHGGFSCQNSALWIFSLDLWIPLWARCYAKSWGLRVAKPQ